MPTEFDILFDPNFVTLASKRREAEEFVKVIDEQVCGWREKRRLVEGLKVLKDKVDAVEQKVQVAKAVGKAKGKLDYDEQALTDTYDQYDLKEKVTAVSAAIQTMIDTGRLTASEMPECLAHLQERLNKAKASGKAQVQEKLETMIKHVIKVKPVEVPVAGLPELFNMHRDYDGIQKLQARKAQLQTDADRKRLATKDSVYEQMKALEVRSRMWFETVSEYDVRLDLAMKERALNLVEEIKREAEEAADKERLAFEQRLEEKKLEESAKQEQKAKELADKIEARRQEAALKPVKAIPQKKVVQKTKKQMNPFELFLEPKKMREIEGEGDEEEDTQASPEASPEAEPSDPVESAAAPEAPARKADPKPKVEPKVDPKAEPKVEPKADPKVEPKAETKSKAVPKKKERPVLENKWGAPPEPAFEQVEGEALELTGEEAAGVGDVLDGPSLFDALKGDTKKKDKIAPPQSKKKGKAKPVKVSASDLGFEC